MLLRDFFAAFILQGMLANSYTQEQLVVDSTKKDWSGYIHGSTDIAYKFADAMLARRAA